MKRSWWDKKKTKDAKQQRLVHKWIVNNRHHSRWSLHWNLLPAATVDGRMVTVLFGSSQLALKIMSIANPSCQTGFDLQTECIENIWKLLTFSYSPDSPRSFPPIQIANLSTLDHLNLAWSLALRCGPLLRRRWNGRASHRKGCETDGPLSVTRGKSSNAAICQQKSKFTMEWLALCQVLRRSVGTVRRTSPLKWCQNAGWPSCWNGKLELHFWDIKVKRCCSKPPGKSLWAFRDASECQCKRVDPVQCRVWLQTSRLSVCVCAEMFGNFLSIYACSLTVLSICMWFLIEYLKAWPAMKKLMPLRLRLVSSITASWMFQLPIAACEPTKRITSGEIDRVDFNLLQHQFFSWFLLVNLPISTHFFLSSWHLLVQCGGIRSSRQSNALRNAKKLGN